MAVSWAARRTSQAPVPVFGVAGDNARNRLEDVALHPRVELTASPRHAAVLLVAGTIPEEHRQALARVHDQIPHPRATLWWGPRSGDWDDGVQVSPSDDPVDALAKIHEDLWTEARNSESHWLQDEPPHPWKGRGDHGQGGEGMMGGTPYGRPMAWTDDDVRDGLSLDRLPFTVGPFFLHFPPGLVLDLALQGDVIQEARVVSMPYPQPESQDPLRGRLRRLHRVLRAAGAGALAERALRRAATSTPDEGEVDRLQRRLKWTGLDSRLCPTGAPAESWKELEARLPGMEWGRAVLWIAGGTS